MYWPVQGREPVCNGTNETMPEMPEESPEEDEFDELQEQRFADDGGGNFADTEPIE